MKSYGRPDESWDEAKFRALIEDVLRTAKGARDSYGHTP